MAPFTPPPGFNARVDSIYGYIPTSWVCITFLSLYGLTTLAHFIEAVYFKLWWLIPTVVIAGIGELIGWSARYWSSFNGGTLRTPFLMQISSTILAPTPLLAVYFIILGRLISQLGPQYSRIGPEMYTIIFCSADVIALVVQAAGGGIASSAIDPTTGGHIMLAGIAIQLLFLVLFFGLATEFFLRLLRDKPVRPATRDIDFTQKKREAMNDVGKPRLGLATQWFIWGASASCGFLFIRAIYRLIELSGGWNGTVILTQWYFNVFDGAMVVSAMLVLNVLHAGYLLHL